MYRQSWRNLGHGGAVTAALLIAEHVALWPERGRLPLPVKYALGVAAIGAGLTVAARERGDDRAVAEFWALAAVGGAVVGAAHLVRAALYWREEHRRVAIYRRSDALRA